MNAQERIFNNALSDISELSILIKEETNEKMILVWNYHLFLNYQIISSILTNNYQVTLNLVAEMQRSIRATVAYCNENEQYN